MKLVLSVRGSVTLIRMKLHYEPNPPPPSSLSLYAPPHPLSHATLQYVSICYEFMNMKKCSPFFGNFLLTGEPIIFRFRRQHLLTLNTSSYSNSNQMRHIIQEFQELYFGLLFSYWCSVSVPVTLRPACWKLSHPIGQFTHTWPRNLLATTAQMC